MKYLFSTVLAFISLLLQFFLSPCISFIGISPDFIIIFLVCAAPHLGISALPMLAALLGAAFDLVASGGIFINTAVYVVFALGLCGVRLLGTEQGFFACAAETAAGILLKGIISTAALYILELTQGISFIFFIMCLPSALYTAILFIPFYFLTGWLMSIRIKKSSDRTIIEH